MNEKKKFKRMRKLVHVNTSTQLCYCTRVKENNGSKKPTRINFNFFRFEIDFKIAVAGIIRAISYFTFVAVFNKSSSGTTIATKYRRWNAFYIS